VPDPKIGVKIYDMLKDFKSELEDFWGPRKMQDNGKFTFGKGMNTFEES